LSLAVAPEARPRTAAWTAVIRSPAFRVGASGPVSDGGHNGAAQVREVRRQLRAAIFGNDGDAVVSLLQRASWPEHGLQLIGDGLLAALGQRVTGAEELARQCMTALRVLAWEGDEVLADGLDSRLGAGPAPLLRPLPVDLYELAAVLEGDPVEGGGRIDLRTGDVRPQPAIDYTVEVGEEDEDEDDPDRWLWVASQGSRAGYHDMELFTAGIDAPDIAERLSRALVSRGAFRRFKDQLVRWPELSDGWYAYSEDRHRGRARAWLADEGYTVTAGGTQPRR
jgi:hypothetical protein